MNAPLHPSAHRDPWTREQLPPAELARWQKVAGEPLE